jgi:hypothetical protein
MERAVPHSVHHGIDVPKNLFQANEGSVERAARLGKRRVQNFLSLSDLSGENTNQSVALQQN